ncbi:hypothetical protein K432DRAFT_342160 [Lepidopterella palustris CBS 459.81]|uniref:Magnesium transporter n=1 Tax=Lepidopterella palustris CBS 459.81 TaxID=1314670 RepID=A0A8E2JKD2_9PEZI|nr:hypothetical protein K432DRAFT_342160 [Lepidopterella palustris CBS 459.81]
MTLLSTSLNALGLLLLTHAVYSAHEHTTLTPTSPSTTSLSAKLPFDITLELLSSVLLICIGVVLASPDLKPIQWSKWAGKLEREGRKEVREGEIQEGNPYLQLEVRKGFLDIREKRKEFADWVRKGATSLS